MTANNQTQIRIFCEQPNPLVCAEKFWNYLSINEASPSDFFPSKFNTNQNPKKMIIFQFLNQTTRDKALNLQHFNAKLTEFNLTLQPPSASNSADHRTIFVNNIPSCIFYYFEPDTLEDVVNNFKNKLYEIEPTLEDHHFIRHKKPNNVQEAPKSMLLTFKTLADATKFTENTTYICRGAISKDNKRFHTNVPNKNCRTCYKFTHRTGSNECDGKKRCPRCLSEEHTTVDERNCQPRCWKHGPGHSSSSSMCPDVRKYKRDERNKIAAKASTEQAISQTPIETQPLHRSVLKMESQIKQLASWSQVAKSNPSQNNPALPNQPPTPQVIQAQPFDLNQFLTSYYAACLNEAADPGKGHFQQQMDIHFNANGLKKQIVPPPTKALLDIITTKFFQFSQIPTGSPPNLPSQPTPSGASGSQPAPTGPISGQPSPTGAINKQTGTQTTPPQSPVDSSSSSSSNQSYLSPDTQPEPEPQPKATQKKTNKEQTPKNQPQQSSAKTASPAVLRNHKNSKFTSEKDCENAITQTKKYKVTIKFNTSNPLTKRMYLRNKSLPISKIATDIEDDCISVKCNPSTKQIEPSLTEDRIPFIVKHAPHLRNHEVHYTIEDNDG